MKEIEIPIIKTPRLKQVDNISRAISKIGKISTTKLVSTRLEPTMKLGSAVSSMFNNPALKEMQLATRLVSTRLESTMKLGSAVSSMFNNPALKEMQLATRLVSTRLEPTMKLGSAVSSMFNNPALKEMQLATRLVSTRLEPTMKLGSAVSSMFNNPALKEMQLATRLVSTRLEPTMKLGSAVGSMFNNSALKEMQETSKLITSRIQALNLDSLELNSLASELFENQSIDEIEESFILDNETNEVLEAFWELFPELQRIKNAYSKEQYIKISIYLIHTIFIYYMFISGFQNTFNIDSSINYIIKGNDVRVRIEPSTENSKSILTKLHNNHYVRKIDEDSDWFKVEFKTKENEVLSGWVYSDYLKEIED